MARIYPFAGWRYAPEKVGDISLVVSPPYDVISPAEAAELKARSPYNAVHIDLPRIANPEAASAEYQKAGALFRAWQQNGVLVEESRPAIYVYRQTYAVPGTNQRRTLVGFIAALELTPFSAGAVLPHEHTFAKPKADRLNLMRATEANLSPVYGFYSDPEQRVEQAWQRVLARGPDVTAIDANGDRHEVWVATGPEVDVAQSVLRDATVFIADGHHRYETALDYQRERAPIDPNPQGAWNSIMMMLVNLDAGGLTILPTHRLVYGIPAPDPETLYEKLGRTFALSAVSGSVAEQAYALRPGEFLVYLGAGRAWLAKRKSDVDLGAVMTERRSPAWNNLDVAVLHNVVLEHVLGLSRAQIDRQENVLYTRDPQEACRAVDKGEAAIAFLLPAPDVQAVKDVALAADVMPHKSTYFYPKLLTGMVFADLTKNIDIKRRD